MKKIIFFLILLFLCNCSFDNKSGIWNKNENQNREVKSVFNEFEPISDLNESFEKEIELNKNYNFKLNSKFSNSKWNDIYYNNENSTENFEFQSLNDIILKSKRLSKYKIRKHFLYDNNKVFLSNSRGDLIVYSIKDDKVLKKFNFYKKKYKNIDKKLNIIIKEKILYVSDNIGFLYAYNHVEHRIIWAKNYKVPFLSNLKIIENKLIAANQNNNLYFFDKNTGDALKLIPTEETLVKNEFVNNLALTQTSVFFLNTYGSLYSIDNNTMKLNWFVNLNQSFDLNPNNLFKGNQIIIKNNKLIITANNFLYVINKDNGGIIYKKNFSVSIKPLVIDEYLLVITNNNLIICLELNKGKILYSYDINDKVAQFLKIKKENAKYHSVFLSNDRILLFLKNSYILIFDIRGNIIKVDKLPSKILSFPIFIKNSLMYLDNRNKFLKIN